MLAPEHQKTSRLPPAGAGKIGKPEHFFAFGRHAMNRGERRLSRILLFFENLVKVPLFGCQQCGECLLSSTAFVCSQNCPKRLRNGPCGGTGEDGSCEVFPDRKCVWYRIYHRSRMLHRISLLHKGNPMHNWSLEGTSAWLNVFRRRADGPVFFIRKDNPRLKDATTR